MTSIGTDGGTPAIGDLSDIRSAEETATSALRSAILQGVLAPGQRLRQVDLAAQLGVSRIPLRDAFRRLEAEGLVYIDGRRGARVATLSANQVAEIYETRTLLEVHCIRLAVRNITDAGVERLIGMSHHMDAVAHDVQDGRLARRAFYAELYRWSGRPRMRQLILQLRDDVHRYHTLSGHSWLEHGAAGTHAQLRDALRDRDPDAAARALRRHLRVARNDLVAALKREERAREALVRRRRQRPSVAAGP
jgi:DNA-binding GntR family transcriptional regulator